MMNFNDIIKFYNANPEYPKYTDNYILFKIANRLNNVIDNYDRSIYHISAIVYSTSFIIGTMTYMYILQKS